MAKSTKIEVSRVNQVVEYARKQKEKPILTDIARLFGFDYKLLWRRVSKNMKPKNEVLPPNRALNVQQEKALGFYIKALDAAFTPPTPNIIEQ